MKSVFITGGSGALGSAIVRKMRGSGWNVAFSYRKSEERALALARSTNTLAFQADLEDESSVRELALRLEREFGPLDALVNNVGQLYNMPFALMEASDWDKSISVNLKTMFLSTHALMQSMIRNKGGSIVNVGAASGLRITERPVAYSAGKSGVIGFTMGLAKELARYKIRVNVVAPGMLDDGESIMMSERERIECLRGSLAGRPGRCGEVAEVVEFLCSDRASYVNAQIINVNGGM